MTRTSLDPNDESLPSQSSFLPTGGGTVKLTSFEETTTPVTHLADDSINTPITSRRRSSLYKRISNEVQILQSATEEQLHQPSSSRNAYSSSNDHGDGNTRKPAGAFPFLKKNSRKEPSAFNRKAAGSPILPLEADFDDVDTFASVDIININAVDMVDETDQCEDDLSKGSYWSMDDTHSFIRTYLRRQSVASTSVPPSDDHRDEPLPSDRNSNGNKAITVSTTNSSKSHTGPSARKDSGSQAVADTCKSADPFLGNSTTSIIAQQWSTKQQEVRMELAEFELIEKQLESSSYEADRPMAQHAAKDNNSDPYASNDSRGCHGSTAASSSKQSVSSYLDSCDKRFDGHEPYSFRPVMLDPVLAIVDSTGVHGSYREGDGIQADSPVRYSSLADRTIDEPVKWETIPEEPSSRVFSDSWGKVTQPANHAAESSSARSEDSSSSSNRMRLSSNTLRKIEARNATILNHHQVTQQHLSDASESRRIQSEDSNTVASSHSTYPRLQLHDDYSPTGPVIRPRPTSAPRSTPTAVGSKQLPEYLLRKSSASSKDTVNRSGHPCTDEQQAHLASKLRELEIELETYRNENATLKKLRKQQEASLSEMLAHKEELLQWVADEKARTAAWCGEQRQMAMKERNAAAKLARDSRQRALSSSLPVRKEKSELEALHATIEKMKIDHEAAAKKSKANEHRLYSLVKDHTTHLESNEKQLLSLEQDKLMLLEFISEQGIRLPKSLRGLLQKGVGSSGSSTGQHAGSSGASKTSGSRHRTDNRNGYVEEVDVEDVGVTSKTALILDDETVSGWNRRSTYSSQRSAVVGKSGSDKSPNLSSTLPSSRHSTKAAERHELIHSTQSRPSNEAKIVDNNKFRPLTSSTADSRNSTAPNHQVGEDAPKPRINDSSAATGSTSHVSSDDQSKQSADPNRIEEVLPNGTKVIRYKNGTLKEVDPSGSSIVRFLNGDSKQYKADSGVVVYYYALADTTHTTHPDGLEIYEFPNKQIEKHFPGGIKEIIFPDSTRKVIGVDGIQECYFPDGIVLREYPDGRRAVISQDY